MAKQYLVRLNFIYCDHDIYVCADWLGQFEPKHGWHSIRNEKDYFKRSVCDSNPIHFLLNSTYCSSRSSSCPFSVCFPFYLRVRTVYEHRSFNEHKHSDPDWDKSQTAPLKDDK